MNSINIVGRLVNTPTAKHIGNHLVVQGTIAVPRSSNTDKQTTDFIDVKFWNTIGANVETYSQKGDLLAVTGALEITSYEDTNGIKRKATCVNAHRVEFLTPKKDKEQK